MIYGLRLIKIHEELRLANIVMQDLINMVWKSAYFNLWCDSAGVLKIWG